MYLHFSLSAMCIDHADSYPHNTELVTVLISAVLYFFLASDPGRIWSTDTRSYRASDDDGSMCGILLGPLLAATMLISSLDQSRTLPLQARSPNGQPLPNPPWLVDSPVTILTEQVKGRFQRLASSTALTMSRSTLLSLQTLLSVIFLTHLVANKWSTRRAIRLGQPINLQTSWTRLSSYIVFSLGVTATLLAVKQALQVLELPVWSAMAPWELVAASIFYQTNMYSISRLGRRSFTLGELTIVAALGVTLTMEAINVTLAKVSRSDGFLLIEADLNSPPAVRSAVPTYDALPQDVPDSIPTSGFPVDPHCRNVSHRISTVTTALPLEASGTETCSSATMATQTRLAQTSTRWFLLPLRNGVRLRRFGLLGEMDLGR